MSSFSIGNDNTDPNCNGVQHRQDQQSVATSSGDGHDHFASANASIGNGSHDHHTNPQIPRITPACRQRFDQLASFFPHHQHLIYHPRAVTIDAHSDPQGRGSFGSVLRATLQTPDGRVIPIAKKIFNIADSGFTECRNYLDVDHPNILKCHGFSVTEAARVCLLLELGFPWLRPNVPNDEAPSSRFAPDHSTWEERPICTPLPRVPFRATEAWNCALQLARGLAYLHDRRVVHADLKHDNIIIVGDKLKIGDLGSAKARGSPLDVSVASTKSFAPPEFMDRLESNAQLLLLPSFDVFSFGVVLASMLGVDPNVIQGSVANRQPLVLYDKLVDLVRHCLLESAAARPKDAGEIVAILVGKRDHDDAGDRDGDDARDTHRRDDEAGDRDTSDGAADELWTNEQFLGLRYNFVAEETRKLSFEKDASSGLSFVLFSQTIDDSSHRLFADFMNPKIHSEKYKLENFRMLQSAYLSSVFLGAHKYHHKRLLNQVRMNQRHRVGINNLDEQQYLEDPWQVGKCPRLSRILFAWHATTNNNVGDVLTHGPSRRGLGIDGVFYLDADRALDQVSGSLEDKRLILYVVSVSQVRMSDDDDVATEEDNDVYDAYLNSETGELMIDYRWRALPVAIGELSFAMKNEVRGEEAVSKSTK